MEKIITLTKKESNKLEYIYKTAVFENKIADFYALLYLQFQGKINPDSPIERRLQMTVEELYSFFNEYANSLHKACMAKVQLFLERSVDEELVKSKDYEKISQQIKKNVGISIPSNMLADIFTFSPPLEVIQRVSLDLLQNILKIAGSMNWYNIPTAIKYIRKAQTLQDKIIAVDYALQVQHDEGFLIDYILFGVSWDKYPDEFDPAVLDAHKQSKTPKDYIQYISKDLQPYIYQNV